MTDDPNDTNLASDDSPAVQWLLSTARERHEQRMEHAAQEPAVVGQWLSDIERRERERQVLAEFARYVARFEPERVSPAILVSIIERARMIIETLS